MEEEKAEGKNTVGKRMGATREELRAVHTDVIRRRCSPYCVPRVIDGIKSVLVDSALREVEPMAWDFVMSFARDNQLQLTEACLIPDALKLTR